MKNTLSLFLCTLFLLGGCDGDEAGQSLNPCTLIPDAGPCEALITKYYFDPVEQTCKAFTWGGCDGVVPFHTLQECRQCAGADRCDLVPDSGPCDAVVPKYYFDKTEQKCKEFIWGGCEGVVPFHTLEECLQCEAANRCDLVPDPGPCKAMFTKYYFDKTERKCKEFIWGGCQGVVPFHTLEECLQCEGAE